MIEITPQMQVSKIFEIAPDSVIIFKNANLDVTGCKADTSITLERVFQQHQTTSTEQKKVLEHLNKQRQLDQTINTPTDQDLNAQEITEGNSVYYKLGGLMFTSNAKKALEQLSEKPGLEIRLQTGGCSGFKYQYDFQDQPSEDQKIYRLSDKLEIYMDDFTFTRSEGSVVDFQFGLHSSGLQIINPNSKRSCSCGISIAF